MSQTDLNVVARAHNYFENMGVVNSVERASMTNGLKVVTNSDGVAFGNVHYSSEDLDVENTFDINVMETFAETDADGNVSIAHVIEVIDNGN